MKDIKTVEEYLKDKDLSYVGNAREKIENGNYYTVPEIMQQYAEYYHKAKIEAISDELHRPKIEETLVDYSLSDVHNEYLKSPHLYMHIKLLDKYIDELENKLLNDL